MTNYIAPRIIFIRFVKKKKIFSFVLFESRFDTKSGRYVHARRKFKFPQINIKTLRIYGIVSLLY